MKILNKVKIILLTIFIMTLIFASKAFATTGIITQITVNMREKPSTDSKRIMYVTQDDIVEILEKDGQWYKIKAKGKTGYVSAQYVKVEDNQISPKDEKENEKQEETTQKEQDIDEIIEDITTDIELKLQIKSKTQIRLIPNITSSIIYTAKKDTAIKVIEQVNNWMYILVDDNYGWVRADKVVEESQITEEKTSNTKSDEEKAETSIAYIKYTSVNLREKASTSSKVVVKLKLNDEVTIIEKTDSKWSKIEFDGKTGYISTELLANEKQKETQEDDSKLTTSRDSESTTRTENVKEKTISVSTTQKEETTTEKVNNTTVKNETAAITSSKKGEEIVAYAKKYLNYNYKSGGTSPKTGFDCSGFTYYVYKHFGYTLSRTSTLQAKNGKGIEKKDLQPGDLLIYKNSSLTKIGHVGIYIGNNKMIHASEPGVGVIITDIDSKAHKYPQRYVTARRII